MEHGLRSRGICLTECVAVAASFAITTAIIIPAAGSLNRGSMESDALGRIRRLSQAHSFYATDFDDRVITHTVDDLTSFGSNMSSAIQSWDSWNASQEEPYYPNPDFPDSTSHPGLRLGWGSSDCVADPDVQSYYVYQPQFNSANATLLSPIYLSGPLAWLHGIGSYQQTNCRGFRAYVGQKYYTRTFYSPLDYGAMEVLERGQGPAAYLPRAIPDCDVEYLNLPPGSFGTLPLFSSFSISPALLFNPEILGKERLITDPFTTEDGLNTPSFSQCRHPQLKTEWLQEYASYTAACGGSASPFRRSLACGQVSHIRKNTTPIPTAFMDGSTSLTTNSQFERDNRRVLRQERIHKAGLWHEFEGLNQTYGTRILTRHLLTVDGILGRDLLDRTPAPSIK